MRLTEVKLDDQEWDSEWFKGCYVGRLRAAEMIMGLTESLSKEGLLFCTIRHMGGKLCLLFSEDKAALKEMIEAQGEWLLQWLEEIRLCSCNEA
ncbi:hypothetical protein Ancab_019661, partial [Ancistrocladus abbreviatus]